MNVETLISTMHIKNDSEMMELIQKMNVGINNVFINQCPEITDKSELINKTIGKNKIISVNEKGLSNSRNLALENSSKEICLLADDDMTYINNYKEIIQKEYEKNPQVDVITFYVEGAKPLNVIKEGKVNYLKCLKLCSVQLSFKRDSIINKGISFDKRFGTGSGKYISGEESIFLFDCLKKGLTIVYKPIKIGDLHVGQSTWFKGYNKDYFITKGACYYRMCGFWSSFLIIQFAIRKAKLYKKEITFKEAVKAMLLGAKEQKKYEKGERQK